MADQQRKPHLSFRVLRTLWADPVAYRAYQAALNKQHDQRVQTRKTRRKPTGRPVGRPRELCRMRGCKCPACLATTLEELAQGIRSTLGKVKP